MKKFKFKLEKLLNYKNHLEEKARVEYAKELQKKIKIDMENNALEHDFLQSEEDIYNSVKPNESISFDLIMAQENFQRSMLLKKEINLNERKVIEENLIPLKENLVKASKEKKIIEKLKEKKSENFHKERNKYLTKVLDDIGGNLHYLKSIKE